VASAWLERRVLNYAHQGGSFEAPSSTLAAIEHALAAGATAIELDVHATLDRQLVVCHDATVDRTTNAQGAIAQMTLEQVRGLDNAYWFIEGTDVDHDQEPEAYRLRGRAPTDPRFGVATLEEVLASFPAVVLNLDIKQTAPEVVAYEALVAEVLERHGRRDDVIVASFSDAALGAFRELSPSTATSAATLETVAFVRALHSGEPTPSLPVVAFQVPEAFAGVTVVDERFVEAAHAAGIAVHVWTLNDEASIRRVVAMGVDGVMSDRPSLVSALLGERAWDAGSPS
jgi:glycerophosphoryl diester phosphodiesterase